MSALTRARIRLWATWVAISVGGQLLGLLILVAAFWLAGTWGAYDHTSPLVRLATELFLVSPFVAFGLGAVPQALLLQRRWAPVWGYSRSGTWTLVGALSGLLFIGYLLYDITSPPGWSDWLAWYLPVTACVALFVTVLQAAALWRMLAAPRLLLYAPLTTLGWVVGWSTYTLTQIGTGLGLSGFLAALEEYLSCAVPLTVIAAASGLVLAGPLATGPRQLPEQAARLRRWVLALQIVVTLVALAAIVFVVVLFSTTPA
jgi:hypothetical protein